MWGWIQTFSDWRTYDFRMNIMTNIFGRTKAKCRKGLEIVLYFVCLKYLFCRILIIQIWMDYPKAQQLILFTVTQCSHASIPANQIFMRHTFIVSVHVCWSRVPWGQDKTLIYNEWVYFWLKQHDRLISSKYRSLYPHTLETQHTDWQINIWSTINQRNLRSGALSSKLM